MAAQRVAVSTVLSAVCVTIEHNRAVVLIDYSPVVSVQAIRSVTAPARSHPFHHARPDEPHRHPEPENHRWRSAC